jgi:hypothetical protein
MWKNFTVRLDGRAVGAMANQKELRSGRQFPLEDGSTLKVQLVQNFRSTELQVLRNDRPLPGSASDPAQRLRNAAGIVFFVAGLNIVLGLIGVLFQSPFLQSLGLGVGSILFGGIFLLLGYFVQRRSMPALVIAVAVFALDGIVSVVTAAQQTGHPQTGGLVARVFLLISMCQGFGAIRALKEEEAGADSLVGS